LEVSGYYPQAKNLRYPYSVERRVTVELVRKWMDAIIANFRYYAGIFLDALRKATKNLGQNSQLLGRDSDEAGASTSQKCYRLSQFVWCGWCC
jgi:hypothetical protein